MRNPQPETVRDQFDLVQVLIGTLDVEIDTLASTLPEDAHARLSVLTRLLRRTVRQLEGLAVVEDGPDLDVGNVVALPSRDAEPDGADPMRAHPSARGGTSVSAPDTRWTTARF